MGKQIAKGKGNQGSIVNGGVACAWFAVAAGEILLEKLLNNEPLTNETCNDILQRGGLRIKKAKEQDKKNPLAPTYSNGKQVINKRFKTQYYAYTEILPEYNGLAYIATINASSRSDFTEQLPSRLNSAYEYKHDEDPTFIRLKDVPLAIVICCNGHWTCAVNVVNPRDNNDETVYHYDSLTNAIIQFDSFNDLAQYFNKRHYNSLEAYCTTLPKCWKNDRNYPIRKNIEVAPHTGGKSLSFPFNFLNNSNPETSNQREQKRSTTNQNSATHRTHSKIPVKPSSTSSKQQQSQTNNITASIPKKSYEPIKDKATILSKLNEETINNNDKAKQCLQTIRSALAQLTLLKNDLQTERNVVLNDSSVDTDTKAVLQNMSTIINQLCGDVAGITNYYLTQKNFDAETAEQLRTDITYKINECLNKEKIKQSSTSTNPIIKRIGPTLRGVVSLLLCITIVPLFSSHVRDHLFANHKEYTLHRAHRIFDNLPQQITLKT